MSAHFVKRLSRHWTIAIGILAVVVSVIVSYYPSLKVGFLGDDWWFLGKAAALPLLDYVAFYFDPRVQIFWYRPLYGILLLFEFIIFRATPEGYHGGQILLHGLDCLLLGGVIWQLTHRWRLSFLSALFYAALPVNALAVFWIAVQDPLALAFYLATVWAWIVYLQRASRFHYRLAFVSLILALLAKESSVSLPLTLFLMDRLVLTKPVSWRDLIRRYVPLGVVFLAYLILEYNVQSSAYFPNRWGYSFGPHVFVNLAHYLALLFFPWGQDEPFIYIPLAFGCVAYLVVGFTRRSRLLLFMAVQAILMIAPALAFPIIFFQARYLYFATTLTALGFAIAVEWLNQCGEKHDGLRILSVFIAIGIVLANGWGTMSAATEWVEKGRQWRVPLRDIYRDHPTYPPDTFLYFVDPPYPMIMRNLTGMFILRYGSNVTVWSNDAEWGGVDTDRFANLRAHRNSFVYYFDENLLRHEVHVDPFDGSTSLPALPVHFQNLIRLEGYEVTASRVKAGAEVVLLLYWQALSPIERDYTVFIHLLNEEGETVFGQDSQPRNGRAPTSSWRPGKLVVDAHSLTIPSHISPGKYRFAIGLYHLATGERLELMDESNVPIGQQIIIEPIEIVE